VGDDGRPAPTDLIDAPGTAEQTGAHPEYPETWGERENFPEPVARLEIGKLWYWPDVESWIAGRE
jgi:hypothetical protein